MTIALPHPGAAQPQLRLPRLPVAERCGYHLAVRPRLRRALIVWATTHLLAAWALAAAPHAVAASMNTALNWTGITDSAGVPIGAYYLSTVGTLEAVTEGGPEVSAWDPGSWIQWGVHSLTTGITHDTIASWLQVEASIYVFMLTAALWLLRFSMSSTWLYWLATWFRPIFDVLHRFLVEHHFYAVCLVLGIAVGAYHVVVRGHHGRGAGIMLTAFVIMIVGAYLLRDPIGELFGDDGLLNQARSLGFSTAQAALNNGPITSGGAGPQLNRLTGQLVDAMVRAPLQIWNFGTTVDGVGSCGPAWSHAILTGVGDAPAHAMQGCGAPHALAYARSLDGSIFALGFGFITLGLLFTVFIGYVSYSYAMVIGAAFLNAILALFAAGPAMIHGGPRARARRRLTEFFRHACYVFVYVLYVSFAAVIILNTVAPGGYATQVGMTNPVAKLVLVAMISAVGTGTFWWLKKELGDRTRQDITHTVTETYHHTRTGYDRGRRTYDRGRSLAGQALERSSSSSGDDTAGESNEPLTAKPVTGRPPARRPSTRQPGSLRPPHATPVTAGPEATGSVSAGTEAATVGAEAGATILAPEVAIPAAAAVAVAHHHETYRRQRPQRPLPAHEGSGVSAPGGAHERDAAPKPTSARNGRPARDFGHVRAWDTPPLPPNSHLGSEPAWRSVDRDDPQPAKGRR